MRKAAVVFVSALFLLSALSPNLCVCGAEEETQEFACAFGDVASISSESIAVKEYDYELETETEVVYRIDGSTKLENVESVQNIQQGNEVSIDYVETDGVRKAVNIYVYEE